jgi:transposase
LSVRALLPDISCLQIERVTVDGDRVVIAVQAIPAASNCPLCGQPSERIHSRYIRKLGDLPWHGKAVRLELHVRKFFCSSAQCPRHIFAERLPTVVKPNARTTNRLHEAHCLIALALGGEAGSRLASSLSMRTSPDTLLRRIRNMPLPAHSGVRVLGVDEWAWRRGHRYGTILCDLERRRLVDLLPERSAESLRVWLQQHPEVTIISRDRGDDYIKGARAGAPQAVQVADRWHLLRNLRDTLMRAIDRHHTPVRQTLETLQTKQNKETLLDEREVIDLEPERETIKSTRAQADSANRRARRLRRFDEVRRMHGQGVSLRAIARHLKLERATVRRYVRADVFPERAQRRRPRQTDRFLNFLKQRWQEGCRNAAQLARELEAQGFKGSYHGVRRQLARWRPSRCRAVANEKRGACLSRRLSTRGLAWLLLKADTDRSSDERALIQALEDRSPELKETAELGRQFSDMVRQRRLEAWDGWLTRARAPNVVKEMRGFADGLLEDEPAVKAALQLPWSNGQVEGQVNRLKTIKRQMYGRANFELLRRRLLAKC